MTPRPKNERQHREAMRRHTLVNTYQQLLAAGLTRNAAASKMGESRSSLDRYERAFLAQGFEGLLPNTEKCGRKRKHQLTSKELGALAANFQVTNRTETSGSVPEAVRMAARRGELRPELAADFLERDRTGRMVPEALARDIRCAAPYVKQHRAPTDAALDYLDAPGSMMWITDEITGEERFIRAGDILEADDATINFPVCVPWEIGGDPCSERYGVKVARFQWLVAIDAATRFVPGYSYTARPRSSYRAEDLVAFYHHLFRTHGIWKRVRNERGSWESQLVLGMVANLGLERIPAWSPHQKPFIEGLFNLVWTKLSDMPGQVGRFRGEMEEENKVLESCKRGATDPREFFPMIGDAISAFDRACAERSEQPVKSQQYGVWVPRERWLSQRAEAEQAGRLRKLPENCSWMFAPVVRDWTVRGNTVGGTVQIMEGFSLRFDFGADWLLEHEGTTVKVHFDPAAPDNQCAATIVSRGVVLGRAVQVNKVARYARRSLGWGEDIDRGLDERRKAASALRRESRAIGAGGEVLARTSEAHDGLGNSARIETGAPPSALCPPPSAPIAPMPLAPRPSRAAFALATPDEFARQTTHLETVRKALEAVAAETE